MSLATKLLRQVIEAKNAAQDEMGVPKYDDLKTPNNHVGKTSNATKEKKVSGLGDRKLKNPTANVGSPGKERRDMEGVKGVKVSESIAQDIGLDVRNGLISFHPPGNPEDVHNIELTPESKKFLLGAVQQSRGDSNQAYALLLDYFEGGAGQDPRNMNQEHPDARYDVGLAAGKGDWPLSEAPGGNNPIAQALSLRVDGGKLYMTSPDGQAGLVAPMSKGLSKALNAYITSPDARADTQAAATRLFQMVGQKVPGVQAMQPDQIAATQSSQSGSRSKGVSKDAGAGLSLVPMDDEAPQGGTGYNPRQRVAASVGESKHKTADGEMSHPSVVDKNPAKTAKVRGKQNDAPTNKGNPGSGKEEKGQPKKQFQVSPKDFKGGENEHKSMKKMHEAKKGLEELLGRKLDLKGIETA